MKIHFIGIGGIGVSALAKYYLAQSLPAGGQGWEVSGCDLVSSEITDQLKNMGVKIRIGAPDPACSAEADKIIYSPAVPRNNPEILNTKYQILSYPEALGELTKEYFTIAVSGTHGKSTTTAMIGLLLTKAGLNPTVVVGTKLKEFNNSNFRMGGQPTKNYKLKTINYLVIEADEHFASFLNYWPKMIVLTTVEADHLDYWKTLQNLLKGFQKYISHLPPDGILVVNRDDKNIQRILISNSKFLISNVKNYSLKQPAAKKLREILKIPGEYNVSNALAALMVARTLKIPDAASYAALSQYKGSWRRFETFTLRQAQGKPYTLVSDYGHHPTEVKVTVEAARSKWSEKTLWLVFQPHQYQRTHYLWKDFVRVLSKLPVQKLILTDIYDVAGREDNAIRKKVSSEKLAKEIPNALYIPTLKEVEAYLKKNLRGGEIVMVMGAGDIYNLTLHLTRELAKRKMKP